LAAWIGEHGFWVILLCVVVTILILRKVYPPFEEKVLKRFLAGIFIVLIAVIYFTAFALTAIGFKVLRGRRLPDFRGKNPKTYWTEREKAEPSLHYLKRQF